MEADRQTQRQGYVWQTLRQLAARLDQMDIPYAVVSGIALQHFGLQRSTWETFRALAELPPPSERDT